MDPAEYDYLYDLEENLWWFVAQRRITEALLRKHLTRSGSPLKVLDAGAGTGGQLEQLQRFGQVTSFDFEPKAVEYFAQRQRGRVLVASTDAIPFADNTFDLVTSFDVICQLPSPNDEMALKELSRVLKPGGTLYVRTPALQALYGGHDVTLHTKHRYTTNEMARKMREAGLDVLQSTYANTFLFPVAATRRLIAKVRHSSGESDVRAVSPMLNTALKTLFSVEATILPRTSLPVGLSVIAIARKP
ncbi:MAG: class I SAM-dependent methyltransferase [Dehalococcoidia bacterium]